MARGPEKYTRYLTDPYGKKVPYDVRWPQQKEALLKKHRELEAILAPAQRAKEYYAPGGGYGKGVEAALERGRVKAMSSGMQALVGAGLAGTTMAGGLGKRYEEEVGMPARARVEETRAGAISGIEMVLANMAQQRGQAATQMQFQGAQAQADREMQRYIADLQASLQQRGPTMAVAPTQTQPQRRTTDSWSPSGLPSATGAGAAMYGIGGGYDAPRQTPIEELMASTTFEWATPQPPTQQQVGMTGAMGRLPGQGYGATGSW